MAAGGASLIAAVVFSVLIMSSLGGPMPLCSDCETMCRTNCTAEAEANCANYCYDTQSTAGYCEGCMGAYFDQHCNPECLKNCSNGCKKKVLPRPLCSDCDTVCSTKCTEELQTTCSEYCDFSRSGLADCQRQLFERCNTEGTCCSSDGTCTCDCETEARKSCVGVSDNSNNCEVCKRGQFDQDCHPTCNTDCNSSCKKKKGCHGHA
ncbi:hypothetical protein CFC21_045193 [Triticum aestivum]|uniref:TNFR-Cys domain-containing protein n=2 Tax=Triticum aestivum TaxID=4565 RepID=A0A9R1FU27_WHEAT|nr:keratin-associated protein 5-1-like [Triticum aestivum]KAF7034128.1 hypothetical protein CFC21_045180 [Triticum aestivum]KAF7034142.1 hypothetical protein CFC21_045193 [Triticum aestivum]